VVFSATSSGSGAFVTTDLFIATGQSNHGGNAVNTTHVTTCTPANIAMSLMRENPTARWAIDPLKNGNSAAAHIGGSSPAPAFAQRWFDLTGRRSLWCNIPVAGTGLLDPGGGTPHWAPTPYATSLVGGYEVVAGYPRDQIITDACDTQDLHPTYARGMRIGVWCGNETLSRAAVRAAQIAVCDARADTFLILNAAKGFGIVANRPVFIERPSWNITIYSNCHARPQRPRVDWGIFPKRKEKIKRPNLKRFL